MYDISQLSNSDQEVPVLTVATHITMCVQGSINLIDAAAKKGVKKFILLTSIGVGDSQDAPPKQVYEVLKPVLIEKGKAEEKLKVDCSPAQSRHATQACHSFKSCNTV